GAACAGEVEVRHSAATERGYEDVLPELGRRLHRPSPEHRSAFLSVTFMRRTRDALSHRPPRRVIVVANVERDELSAHATVVGVDLAPHAFARRLQPSIDLVELDLGQACHDA